MSRFIGRDLPAQQLNDNWLNGAGSLIMVSFKQAEYLQKQGLPLYKSLDTTSKTGPYVKRWYRWFVHANDLQHAKLTPAIKARFDFVKRHYTL